MTTLIENLFRLKFASTIMVEDSVVRERRIAEIRALLAEIAEPAGKSQRAPDFQLQEQEPEPSFA
jgi:hypothetical protein